jgi:hypothetical protein
MRLRLSEAYVKAIYDIYNTSKITVLPETTDAKESFMSPN